MSKLLPTVAAVALALGASVSPAAAHDDADQSKIEIGLVKLDNDITLRRKVVRNRQSKGVVLLLHGFPKRSTRGKPSRLRWPVIMRSMPSIGQAMAFPHGHRRTSSLMLRA